MDNNELYHHGVKGMKWGVRRTPAQLGHRTSSKRKSSSFGFGKSKKKTTKSVGKQDQTPKKKSIKDMTDDELREKIARLELEKSYRRAISDIPAETTSRGKKLAMEILENSARNVGTQTVTYIMGKGANKMLGMVFDDMNAINPKKGQKDK